MSETAWKVVAIVVFLVLGASLAWCTKAHARPVTVTHVTMTQLQVICRGRAIGCAFWRNPNRPCRIYLPHVGEPSFYGQTITHQTNVETMVHERAHCAHGVTHSE